MRLKGSETFPLSLLLRIICHTLTTTAHSRASFVFCSVIPHRRPQKKRFIIRYCKTHSAEVRLTADTCSRHARCPSYTVLRTKVHDVTFPPDGTEACTQKRDDRAARRDCSTRGHASWQARRRLPRRSLQCADLSEGHLPAKKRTIVAAHVQSPKVGPS